MAICKYFMQGHCQYGDKCWNEHPQGPRGGGSGKSVSFRNSFTPNQNPFTTLGHSVGSGQSNSNSNNSTSQQPLVNASSQDIINTISTEMQTWDKSKMWPFSCFKYWKDCSCLPEFDDVSPEEMRCEAYEAQKTNTFQQFVRKVTDMKNKLQQLRSELIQPNMQSKQKLIQLIEDERRKIQSRPHDTVSNSFSKGLLSQPTGTFSSNPNPSVFGGSGQPASTSVFGGGASTASVTGSTAFGANVPFDLSTRVFGGLTQPASNGFGTGAAMQSSSIFGGSGAGTAVQPNSAFGGGIAAGTSGATNPFGISSGSASGPGTFAAPATQSVGGGNVFGNTSVAGTSIFGSGSASAVATPPSSVFGGGGGSGFGGPSVTSVQPQVTTGFGSVGVFGGGQTSISSTLTQNLTHSTSSIFGGSALSGVGGAGQTTSVFGASAISGGVGGAGQTSSGFGGSIANTSASQVHLISTLYTPLSELTPEEKSAFEADRFILGQIPTRPPPKELC